MKKPKVLVEDLPNDPCEKCALLGRTSEASNGCLVLLTLSPNPQWKNYGDRLPDTQLFLINGVLADKQIRKKAGMILGYKLLGTHYEFAQNGNLHTHSIVSIDKKYAGTDRALITLSKLFHQVIGQQWNKCSISADTKYVLSDMVYKYINKENAYNAYHNENIPNIENYLIKDVERLTGGDEPDDCGEDSVTSGGSENL